MTLDPIETGTCQMSTCAALADVPGDAPVSRRVGNARPNSLCAYSYRDVAATDRTHDVPGADRNSKHPAVAVDAAGNILIAWAAGTGWQKGGSVAWQVFDRQLKPITGETAARRPSRLEWSRRVRVAGRRICRALLTQFSLVRRGARGEQTLDARGAPE